MLVAFYIDNGKQRPLWRDLPHFMYWMIPMAIGMPLVVRALLWLPLARARAGVSPTECQRGSGSIQNE